MVGLYRERKKKSTSVHLYTREASIQINSVSRLSKKTLHVPSPLTKATLKKRLFQDYQAGGDIGGQILKITLS